MEVLLMHSFVPSRRARRALWRWAAALLFLAATHPPAQAGGPLGITPDGQPYRWDSSNPVRYIVDAGPLGPRSHAAAVAMVERAFQAWKNVPTARLQFESAGEL